MPNLVPFWAVFSSIKLRNWSRPIVFSKRSWKSLSFSLQTPLLWSIATSCFAASFLFQQIIWASAEFWFVFWSVMTCCCCQMVLLGYIAQWEPPKSEGKLQVVLCLTCQLGILSPLLVNGFSWVWNQSSPIQVTFIFSVKKTSGIYWNIYMI